MVDLKDEIEDAAEKMKDSLPDKAKRIRDEVVEEVTGKKLVSDCELLFFFVVYWFWFIMRCLNMIKER